MDRDPSQKRRLIKEGIREREKGFTLVELLVSMAIALIVIAAVAGAFLSQRKTYDTEEQVSEMTQSARGAMDMITREIQMAGFNPTGGSIVGIPYSATQLEIRADLNGDGDTSDTNEDIIYTQDATNKKIIRNEGGTAQTLVENIESFTFQYFDKDGNVTTTPADIRKIQVTITARTAIPDPNYTDPTYADGYRRYTLTSDVTPKNLDL